MLHSTVRSRAAAPAEVSEESGEDVPTSLREVAAYLRGVADAVRSVSSPAVAATDAPTARRTLPIGAGPARQTLPHPSVPTEEEEATLDRWADERQSEVRLRVPRLSSQWFDELTGTDDA
jgi:hypothetical protein